MDASPKVLPALGVAPPTLMIRLLLSNVNLKKTSIDIQFDVIPECIFWPAMAVPECPRKLRLCTTSSGLGGTLKDSQDALQRWLHL